MWLADENASWCMWSFPDARGGGGKQLSLKCGFSGLKR